MSMPPNRPWPEGPPEGGQPSEPQAQGGQPAAPAPGGIPGWGTPGAPPAGSPYGAPPGYGGPPGPGYGGGPPPGQGYGGPPPGQGYGGPPPGQGYGGPPPGQGYGGPPPGQGYGGPPPGQGYGGPPPGQGYGGPPPGQGYGGPPPGQGYGGPPPGQGYGGPPPGQGYGGPPPGAGFGAPQPGYGAFPPGGQFGQAGPRPPAGPSPGIGVVKIVVALFFAVILIVAYLQQSYKGYGTAFALAVLLGLAVRGVAVGAANVAKKRIAILPSFAITGVVGVIGALLGPTASEAFSKANERSQWDEVTALESGTSFSANLWKTKYEDMVDAKWRRPAWKGRWMLARVKDAIRDKKQSELRVILREISAEPPADAAIYVAAKDEAARAFKDYYDQAKSKMFAAPSGGDGKPREFAIDEALRGAFVALFEDLARSPDANVYVLFTNSVKLDAPKGTDQELAFMRKQPQALAKFPKGDAPVIAEGQAFSPSFDSRRRQTFMTALSESFGQVFDADLLTLVPMTPGADRKGKIVFEVTSAISRTNDFYVYTHSNTETGQKDFVGFLFGIYVDWGFRILDRAGSPLYDPKPIRSQPADNVRVRSDEGDPQWSMYSVMMDSAYYNYSRVITGKFGLTPPPVRESFSYEGAK